MFPLKDDIPTRTVPVVTLALIAANVLVFVFGQGGWWDQARFDAAVTNWGAVPADLIHPSRFGLLDAHGPLTAVSSMFLHGGVLHLAGNMLFLWVFGTNVEDAMGRGRFVCFYLAGGLAALGLQVAVEPSAAVPTVGASGAIAAVLGGYALLYPRARVVTLIFVVVFFTVVTIPAMAVMGAWFVLQAFYALGSVGQPVAGGGGVAYFAHVGGFVFGLALVRLFATRARKDYLEAAGAVVSAR